MVKKLTIENILEKKKLIEKTTKNYFSKFFDAEIEIKEVNKNSILEILADKDAGEYDRYLQLVYLCCPIFKAEELRKNFEIKTPYEIIDKVFNNNISEVMNLGNFILQKYGLLDEDLIEKVKKQ